MISWPRRTLPPTGCGAILRARVRAHGGKAVAEAGFGSGQRRGRAGWGRDDGAVRRARAHPLPGDVPGPLGLSLTGRALADGLWRLEPRNIRDVATDRHRTVDDTPAGGGAGMVLRADIAAAALDAAESGLPRAAMAGDLPLAPRPALRPGAGAGAGGGAGDDAALRALRGHRRAGARGARGRGGEPRRLRDDRRRDRGYGLDRRHGSAYTPRPRERRLDGGGILRRRASGVSAIHTPDRMGRSADTRGSPLGPSRTDRRLATRPGGEADQGTSSRPLAGLPRASGESDPAGETELSDAHTTAATGGQEKDDAP